MDYSQHGTELLVIGQDYVGVLLVLCLSNELVSVSTLQQGMERVMKYQVSNFTPSTPSKAQAMISTAGPFRQEFNIFS